MKNKTWFTLILFWLFATVFLSCSEYKEVTSLKKHVLKTYGQDKDTLYYGDTIVNFAKYWKFVDEISYRSVSETDSGSFLALCYIRKTRSAEIFYFCKGKLIDYTISFEYKDEKKCLNRFLTMKNNIIENYPMFKGNLRSVKNDCSIPITAISEKHQIVYSQKYSDYIFNIDFCDSCEARFYLSPLDINYRKFRDGEAFDEKNWREYIQAISERSR